MTWILYSVIARLLWGITNLGEKYFVDKRFKDPFVYIIVAFVLGILAVFLIPFVDFFIPDFVTLALIFLASCCFFFGALFYIRAIKKEEATRINIMWGFMPIFTFIGGWFLLAEKLNGIQFLAFTILIFGGFLASLHAKRGNTIKLSEAVLLMMIACLFFSSHDLIARFLTQKISFSVLFIFDSIFLGLVSLSLFLSKKFRSSFAKERKNLSVGLVGLVAGINFISKVGLLFNIWAISLGPVALVNATEGMQVLFVFIIASLLTVFAPKIIKEELDKKNVMLKVVAMILMIVGVIVLSLNS